MVTIDLINCIYSSSYEVPLFIQVLFSVYILVFDIGLFHTFCVINSVLVWDKIAVIRSTVFPLPAGVYEVFRLRCISKLHACNSFPSRHLVISLI